MDEISVMDATPVQEEKNIEIPKNESTLLDSVSEPKDEENLHVSPCKNNADMVGDCAPVDLDKESPEREKQKKEEPPDDDCASATASCPLQKDINIPSENTPKLAAADAISKDLIHELDTGYRILTDIIKQNKTTCWPFMDEVDIKGLGLWDYSAKIKEPMWLNKILEKFDKGLYTSVTGFVKDFRTMVENCYRYNSTDHAISKKAKRLEMALEGKLALLKKELKDKTSLQVTSGGKFSLDMNEDVTSTLTRSGRAGNMREYASVHDDTSAKLIYDFVKCEETVLLDDERKASHRERRQQELLYQRIAAVWINALDSSEEAKLIKTSSALPEIGFFLHLCEGVLKFPELNMYSLERSFLIPEDSIYLAKIMTSLLCSYQERSQLSARFPMLFATWNKRLKEKVSKWFELAQRCKSYVTAAERLGISVAFFKCMDWKNVFSQEKEVSYSDLAFDQRVQVAKALCDNLFLLQSVQSAMLSMDAPQLQCMTLGKDCYGNNYIYFPQFCGDDVRIYRHCDYGEPIPDVVPDVYIPPPPATSSVSDVKSAKENGENKEEAPEIKKEAHGDALLEKTDVDGAVGSEVVEPMVVGSTLPEVEPMVNGDGSEMKAEETEVPPDANCRPTSPVKENPLTPIADQLMLPAKEAVNTDDVPAGATIKNENIAASGDIPVVAVAVKENPRKPAGDESVDPAKDTVNTDNVPAEATMQNEENEYVAASVDTQVPLPANVESNKECTPDAQVGKRTPRTRKRNPKYDQDTTYCQQSARRSLRKRNPAPVFQIEAKQETPSPKKKRKTDEAKKSQTKKTKKEPHPPRYGNVDFEMLCDSVSGILDIVSDLENQQKRDDAILFGKAAMAECGELIERLQWLHGELLPWEAKMQKAKLTAQIQMKKECDELKNPSLSKRFDIWSEELTNKNSYLFGDNLTIAHQNVDSPMSSVASYDGDTGDEDYTHPYFTRKTASPTPPQFDEELYRVERERLLAAALHELEDVLRENMRAFYKLAVRSDLQDSAPSADGRRTRQKLKQQNKVLGKILVFAEEHVTERPSMLPILIPDNDLNSLVEVLLTEEESRLREAAMEQRRKRKSNAQKAGKAKPLDKEILKTNSLLKKDATSPNKKFTPQGPTNLAIRMNNGKIYAATRLGDGTVIPIVRSSENSPVAASVQELIESTHNEIKHNAGIIPHISLRAANGTKKAPQSPLEKKKCFRKDAILKQTVAPKPPQDQRLLQTPPKNPNQEVLAPQTQQFSVIKTPPKQSNSTLSLGTVTVKRSPIRVGTQKLIGNINNLRQIHDPRMPQNAKPAILNRTLDNSAPTTPSQSSQSMVPVVRPTVSAVSPVVINGSNYRIVNIARPSFPATSAIALARPQGFVNSGRIYLSQPAQTVIRPIITPVQLLTTMRYAAPTVAGNSPKAGNMVIVPLQTCPGANVSPVQIVTNPVLQVVSSPQKQSQLLGDSNK